MSVSHTAAYWHFTDEADLVAAVMAQGFDELRTAAEAASHGPPSCVDAQGGTQRGRCPPDRATSGSADDPIATA